MTRIAPTLWATIKRSPLTSATMLFALACFGTHSPMWVLLLSSGTIALAVGVMLHMRCECGLSRAGHLLMLSVWVAGVLLCGVGLTQCPPWGIDAFCAVCLATLLALDAYSRGPASDPKPESDEP